MHTTQIRKTVFIHNGTYEDKVEIVVGDKRLWVPVNDLKGFVAKMEADLMETRLEAEKDGR